MSSNADLLTTACGWLAAGSPVALATVIETWGSSPRPLGSLLAVRGDGVFAGSVSGGCLEPEVVSEALDVLETGTPRLLDYGVSDAQAWAAGLACGGRLRVQVRPVADAGLLQRLAAAAPAALVHALEGDAVALVTATGVEGDLALDDDTLAAVREAIAADRSTLLPTAAGAAFALVLSPPLRLIVVGAVHITESLVPLAREVGFEVTVVEPRPAFAAAARLPGVAVVGGRPERALAELVPDSRSAVVTLTHDPQLDDPALVQALASPAFHVGALGSTRSHARRLERLRARGLDDAELARIKGPVGLPLGGRRPPEIALSIVAELVAARYARLPWPA